jgi:hypothetical protein
MTGGFGFPSINERMVPRHSLPAGRRFEYVIATAGGMPLGNSRNDES